MRELPTSYIASSRLRQEFVRGVEFEMNQITMPRWVTNRQAQKVLTEQAEYGGWELVRLRRYRDGTRDVWLRRRVIRVRPTYLAASAD